MKTPIETLQALCKAYMASEAVKWFRKSVQTKYTRDEQLRYVRSDLRAEIEDFNDELEFHHQPTLQIHLLSKKEAHSQICFEIWNAEEFLPQPRQPSFSSSLSTFLLDKQHKPIYIM